jgi:hypothetical protein
VSIVLTAVAAVVVVNEVLYDPAGPDTGREFVELYAVAPVALAGWTLEAGDGARGTWRVVWRGIGGELTAGGLAVVGGDSVAGAAARLQGELQNGPDALRLVDPRGAVHDRIGWGALTDAAFFETRPAADAAGRSLGRDPDGSDSDDNERDFAALSPSPGRRNRAGRELVLALVPPDPLHAWPGRTLRAGVHIRNVGLEPVADWDVTAAWRRFAGQPPDPVAVRSLSAAGPRGAPLAPGDSTELVLGCSDAPGLYRLEVRGRFADEDSTSDAAAAWVRIGAGDVLVDEILYAPAAGEPEWIELRNRGAHSIALAGFTLTDRSGRRATLRGAARLAAGGRGILAADTTTAIRALAPHTPRWAAVPWPSLNDDGDGDWADALVLRDAAGIVQDACGYPPAARERGRSLERVTPDPDARGVGWAACTARAAATPGAPNSIATAASGTGAGLVLAPNPFSPDGDGVADRLVVQAAVPAGYEGCRIEIYDLEGRRRAQLLADALGPGPRSLAWDGTGESGQLVEAGAYILSFECRSKSGPGLRTRRAVGVVRP